MKVEIKKEFKNGNKIIAVKREVVTFFKLYKNGEVEEKNTIDEIKDNLNKQYTQKFWEAIK